MLITCGRCYKDSDSTYSFSLIPRGEMVKKVFIPMVMLVESDTEKSFAELGYVVDILSVLKDTPRFLRKKSHIHMLLHCIRSKIADKFMLTLSE